MTAAVLTAAAIEAMLARLLRAKEHDIAVIVGEMPERDLDVPDNLLPVPHGVPNPERLATFAVEKDGQKLHRNCALDHLSNGGEQIVQIQGLGSDGRHFQQEVQQFLALAKWRTCFGATHFASQARHIRGSPPA